ncbi:MAG: hypothetical protein AAGD38_15055 [Acidobacteriota bacterium]
MTDEARGINIRNLSVRSVAAGDDYPALARFRREEDHNVYTYEYDNHDDLLAERIEVAVAVIDDVFARRDPGWRGGRIHAREEGEGDEVDELPPTEAVDVRRLEVSYGAESLELVPVSRTPGEEWIVYGFATERDSATLVTIEVPSDRDVLDDDDL